MTDLPHPPECAKHSCVWGPWNSKGDGRKVTRSTTGVQRVWLWRLGLPLTRHAVYFMRPERAANNPQPCFRPSPNLGLSFSLQVHIIFCMPLRPTPLRQAICIAKHYSITLSGLSLGLSLVSSEIKWPAFQFSLKIAFLLSSSVKAMLIPTNIRTHAVPWKVYLQVLLLVQLLRACRCIC